MNDFEDPRAALNSVGEAQRATLRATRRPAWLTFSVAIAMAAMVTFALLGYWAVALGVLVACAIPLVWLETRITRRRGRIVDERAFGAYVVRILPITVLFAAIRMISVPTSWQPWPALAAGLLVGVIGWVFMRMDERYQERRIVAGDYDQYTMS